MKTGRAAFFPVLLGFLIVGPPVEAQRRSLLDDDPEVVLVEEFTDREIDFLVIKPGKVLSTRKGGRRLGVLKVDTKVRLLAITEKAYRIRGTATHGPVSGWVSPESLGSKDRDFVENFKKVYERTRIVRDIIANKEVAIGMSLTEVIASLGEPNKTKVRQTAKGKSGRWEFVEYEKTDHFTTVRDPVTGAFYRRFSHTTLEETGKIAVDFEDDVVTAIEKSENVPGAKTRIIVPPVVFHW